MHLRTVHFDIVSGCQLSCVGCPSAGLRRKVKAISLENFKRCLENIDVNSIGIFRCFNYGEPLLHNRVVEILQILKDFRLTKVIIETVELSTNAQTVNWPSLEQALELGLLDRLVVSCDGDGTAASFEKLRPPARWEVLVDFLTRVGAIVNERNISVELMTRTVVENTEQCENWLNLLEPLGWRPEFRSWKYLPESPKNMTGREIVPANGICKFLETEDQLFVDSDGSVVPCCIHPRAAVLGNLQLFPLSKILVGEDRSSFLENLKYRRGSMQVCASCEFGPNSNPGPSAGNREPI